MADRGLIMPRLFKRRYTNRQEMLGGETGYLDTAQLHNANCFVFLNSGSLNQVGTAGQSVLGWCPNPGYASTTPNPPYNMFGGNSFPFNPNGQQFLMSVTDSSFHIGQANSAPTITTANLAVGQQYGIITKANSAPYNSFQAVNISDTSTKMFTIVDLLLNAVIDRFKQDVNTYNPLVVVEIIGTTIQVVG